jgi:hypothetical protein
MKALKKIVPLLIFALVLTPINAQAKTSVIASPTSGLDATSAVVQIKLSDFPTKNGLYIQQCNAPVNGARPTECSTARPLWISSAPGASFAPTADIAFKPTALYASKNGTVDCTVTSCGIWISNDHDAIRDTSEDQFIALTFKSSTTVVALPEDEITASLNGAVLATRTASELGYRAVGKLAATAKSAATLTYASSTPDCTVVNGVVTALKGSGACNIQVISPGSASFAPYTANYPLKLIPGTQAVKPGKFPTSLSVGTTRAIVAESNFGSSLNFRATTKNICAIEANLLVAKKKGSCVLIASAPARTNMWEALKQRVTIKIK